MISLSTYSEDISQGAAGTILVAGPCQVFQITVIADIGDNVVVNFANSATGYAVASRNFKVALTGLNTHTVEFPHGLNCTSGLSAVANTGSVDIFVSYE
jgi:hypothetical protein